MAEPLRVASQITAALDHAHRRGVVHRDLKPSNILATKEAVKLLDFGLAKMQPAVHSGDDTQTIGITQEGAILGTPCYMSPEQAEGRQADARSDVFSFGAMLYELLTGKRAFRGDTPASVLAAVLKEEPSPAPQVTGPLESVLRRCLAKDPDERWQSAADFAVGAGKSSAVDGGRGPYHF
jgi:serine/threonine protein kinase